jgi:hypothetical protein
LYKFLIFVIFLVGCGRVIKETDNSTIFIPIPIDGTVTIINEFMVSFRMDETQKNPSILRYDDDLILITYLDNHNDRINLVYYSVEMERLNHKILNHQYPVAHGSPEMSRFNDNILIVYEAFSGGYLVMYDINGNRVMNDIKIAESVNDDLNIHVINSRDVMLVYEERNQFQKKSVMCKVLRLTLDNDKNK